MRDRATVTIEAATREPLLRALERLGFGLCHHGMEVLGRGRDAEHWLAEYETGDIEWSSLAEELLGYPPEEILGRPETDLRMERDSATRIWRWWGGYGDENYRAGLVDLRHHDGRQIMTHSERVRIVTPGGVPA